MKTLPVNLQIENLPVLIVGGGALAAEKLEKLLPYRPRITLLCPRPGEAVRALAAAHPRHLTLVNACYSPAHLEGFSLVFAATNNPEVNRRIHADTRGRGILLNAVDMPACCDFIMPAVVAGEHFTLAISTGGMAAGLARQWREELEAALRQEDDILVVLERIRGHLKRKVATFAERRERLWSILRELETIEAGTPPP